VHAVLSGPVDTEGWRAGVAKALERQNAALLDAAPVAG
jgi:hypothetical protein